MKKYIPLRKFGPIRRSVLRNWLLLTGRKRVGYNDTYNKYECAWQTKHQTDDRSKFHYSVFCSMGDWNTNLTDLLEDNRLDQCYFSNEDHKAALFRFYTRIFLVCSEIYTDFQDLISTFEKGELLTKKEFYEASPISRARMNEIYIPEGFEKFFQYINNLNKHKLYNLHMCNHHVDYFFVDSFMLQPETEIIKLENIYEFFPRNGHSLIDKHPTHIEVPQLSLVVELVSSLYHLVSKLFENEPDKYEKFRIIFRKAVE